MSWLPLAKPSPRPRPATPGTVYASHRCVACGRIVRLTVNEPIAPVTAATRPYDVTDVDVCVDWRDCRVTCRKKGMP